MKKNYDIITRHCHFTQMAGNEVRMKVALSLHRTECLMSESNLIGTKLTAKM